MKIQLNKKLDIEVYLAFFNAVVGGADFGKKIRNDHPNISHNNYVEYINDYYSKNENVLNTTLIDTRLCFEEIKHPLFIELQNYFNKDYSAQSYTCYLSIFDCNPRYLETKSFQVYYKRSHNMRKEVIAHEVTHFAFYDFCDDLGFSDDEYIWELSELFNVIFLNIPSIQKAIGAEELLFYPNLKAKLEEVKKIWAKKLPAEKFIKQSLQKISKIGDDKSNRH